MLLALGFMLAGSLIVMALLSWTGDGLTQVTAASTSASLRYAATTAVQVRIQDLRYRYQATHDFSACDGWPLTSSVGPPPGVAGATTQAISVYCSIETDETSANSRTITMEACPATPTITTSSLASAVAGSTTISLNDAVPAGLNPGMLLAVSEGGFPAGSMVVSIDPVGETLTMSQAATTNYGGNYAFDGACTSNPYVTAVVAFDDFDANGNGSCSPSSILTCGESMTIVDWRAPF